jgi:hypothetical protein
MPLPRGLTSSWTLRLRLGALCRRRRINLFFGVAFIFHSADYVGVVINIYTLHLFRLFCVYIYVF